MSVGMSLVFNATIEFQDLSSPNATFKSIQIDTS